MPSNPYSGMPKMCLLCTTAPNGRPIDLLNARGICITNPPGWTPQITTLKGGGVRVGSQTLDDDWLVAGAYGAVGEAFPVRINAADTAARVQELLMRLQEAAQYWIDGWQRDAVYLKVQLTEDHGVKYSRIKTGSYRIGNYAFGDRTGLPNNVLVLEREPYWNGAPPNEMLGPFANWCPNPSFEYWSDDGIVDAFPTGWYGWLDSGLLPPTLELRREDQQIAGPDYALDINFAAALGAGDYRLTGRMNWPGSPEQATLRFWLFLTLTAATHTFSVRVINNKTGAAVATASFTSDYQGYYYLPVDAPFIDDGTYSVELRWQFVNSFVPSRSVIDHICFTPGIYDEDSWPSESFYLTCSNIWNWEDDEMHYGHKRGVGEDVQHPINFLDVSGVPGSAPAIMELNVSHLGAKYGDDKNYPIINYVMGSQVHEAGKRSKDEYHISMNGDGPGYTGTTEKNFSSESYINARLTTTYSAIYCWRADALAETSLYTGRFKVFGRMRWVPTAEGVSTTLQLEHWIGSQVGLLQQDEVILEPSDQYRMVNLTPRSVVDWSIQADTPAALGLRLNGKTEEEAGNIVVDFLLFVPTDAGMTTITFDENTPWLVGQAISIDGNPNHQPISVTSPFFPWVRESSMLLVAEGLDSWLCTDAEAFTGSLYVSTYNVDVTYDYQIWIPIKWRSTFAATKYPVDIVNNGWDTATLIGAAKMLASGNDLRVFDNGVEIDRWLQDINTATTQVWANLDFDPKGEAALATAIAAGGFVSTITVSNPTTDFPNSGILLIDSEAFEYTSKNDTTMTFGGVTRAIRGTTSALHNVGAAVWWIQHDLWIKYGNAAAAAPTVDDDYKPAFRLDSTNVSWDYDDFGEDDELRAAQWFYEAPLPGYTYPCTKYTANHGGTADPWQEMGITWDADATASGRWWLYNPCGISSVNYQNGEHYRTLAIPTEQLTSSMTGVEPWTLEYTIPTPGAGAWVAWSRNETMTANTKYVGIEVYSLGGGSQHWLEVADVTVALLSSDTPSVTIGDEQSAAQGKLLRFDHRGWAQVAVHDEAIRALETWGAYLYYIADTSVIRYRVISGTQDFITGTASYYDLRAYAGSLWLASDAGKIFYSDDDGNVTESTDQGSQVWQTMEVYKRNLYVGADTGAVAVYNPIDGWSISTTLAGEVRKLKTWNGKLYASVDQNGVYSFDGQSWTNVLSYDVLYGEMGGLEVYDDLLFVGTGNNGGDAYVIYTEDGINWTENIFPASSVTMAMEPFDGRLFIGFGFLFGADEWASEWLIWHTRAVPKLYLAEHTGGPFTLYPDRINRYYQMMEVLNTDVAPEYPECYLERDKGPQTHIGVSFIPRWHVLRED